MSGVIFGFKSGNFYLSSSGAGLQPFLSGDLHSLHKMFFNNFEVMIEVDCSIQSPVPSACLRGQ